MSITNLISIIDYTALALVAGAAFLVLQSLTARLRNEWVVANYAPRRRTRGAIAPETTPDKPTEVAATEASKPKPEPTQYTSKWKAADLRREAAQLGVKGAARMKKADLLVALNG